MDNLEKMRQITKKKLIVMILSTALPLLIVLVMQIGNFKISEGSIFSDLPYLPWIICVIFELYLLFKIIKYARILKNDEFANQIIIKRHDERRKYIVLKSNALVAKIFIYVMGVVIIFTAFVDMNIFWPCLSIFIAFMIIQIIVTAYYNKKY
ncbi:MAG: hypothetical protein ACI35S_02655 [Anaeroplasma sp.]